MNIFSPMTSFLKRLRGGAQQDPVRDWLTMLTLAIVACAGIIVWNIWAFDTVARGGVIGSAIVHAPPAFSRASLDAIHAIFEKRVAEESKYETGEYRYADPSQ